MPVPMRAALLALLSLASLSALAQEPPPALCRAHVDGQWQTLGRGSLESCLKAVDQAVIAYNNQGFKFGLAGRQMLAADANYFYRSEDSGRIWGAFGYRPAVKPVLEAAPPLLSATATPALAEAPAPLAAAPELRTCSVYGVGAWKPEGELSLQACGDALDKTSNQYDANGYKYGYWGKLYLAADAQNLLHSDNGNDWTPLRPR